MGSHRSTELDGMLRSRIPVEIGLGSDIKDPGAEPEALLQVSIQHLSMIIVQGRLAEGSMIAVYESCRVAEQPPTEDMVPPESPYRVAPFHAGFFLTVDPDLISGWRFIFIIKPEVVITTIYSKIEPVFVREPMIDLAVEVIEPVIGRDVERFHQWRKEKGMDQPTAHAE